MCRFSGINHAGVSGIRMPFFRNMHYDMDKEIRLLLNQKIELLIYIINLQNHYLSVPFELPAEFQINKLPF